MDYRRVEKRYRWLAVLIQTTLVGGVVAYAGFEVRQMFDPTETVPVQSTLQEWRGAGRWALCSQLAAPDSLLRAGVALPTSSQTLSDHYVYNSVGSPIKRMNIDASDRGNMSCAVIDLTTWAMPPPPLFFQLCVDSAANSDIFIWQNEKWQWLQQDRDGTRQVYRLDKHVYGWNLGYNVTTETYYQIAQKDFSCCGTATRACGSHWEQFSGKTRKGIFYRVIIDTPAVPITLKQGVLPRLFALCNSIGGYFSFFTLVFGVIFVKRYPDGEIAVTYEARTLRGMPQQTKQESLGQGVGNIDAHITPEKASVGLARRGSGRRPPPPLLPRPAGSKSSSGVV